MGSARVAGRYLLLVVCAAIVFLPIYTAVVVSIQPATRLLQFPSVLIPSEIDLGVFARAYDTGRLGRYLLNSALVSTVIVAGQLVTSVLAAYAFAYLAFPAKRWVFLAFLATLMIPSEVTLVANYETVQRLGWLDTYQVLAVPFLATAFGTFLLRQSFLQVPQDLRDAAALDGYGHRGFLFGVALPLARPALGALTVFSFLLAWNQYLWPLLVTNDSSHRTVQIGLKSLISTNIDELNLVMAGTVLAGLPIFVLLLVFQRQLVRGLTSGAVKG
ncbi:MAG: carbohydrate ABC transporter permease [Acidimicrobiia bacterium]|nr:carbohydrate ABC transporter permease [Acidimicrobiia bacterium]